MAGEVRLSLFVLKTKFIDESRFKKLCLGITGQDCITTAVVKSGDTCATIAAAARIDVATLKANNQNVNGDCSNIRPGEVSYFLIT